MTNSTDTLTTIETTLRDVLANLTAARTGTLARAHGWPQPDEAQCREITGVIIRALTELVRGMRRPDALPPNQDELQLVLENVALGVLERVMGVPTASVVH